MKEYSELLETRGVKCRQGYSLEAWNEILLMSNDAWTVFTCSPHNADSTAAVGYGSRYTQVIRTDLSQSWTISHKDFDWAKYSDSYLRTYTWSPDGKHLYLVPQIFGIDWFSISGYFHDESNLYRLDLTNGNFETLAAGVDSFSLSPDHQLLIYSQADEPAVVHIKNLGSGETQEVHLDDQVWITGIFIWDPDSTRVVFASGYGKNNGDFLDDLSATSVYLLTIKDLRLRTFLNKDPRLLVPLLESRGKGYWIDKNTISLTSLQEGNEFMNDISLDIQTGKITGFVTPTVESKATATP